MKKRILQLIEAKRITKVDFFSITGLKRGFLDSDKLNQSVNEHQITMIIAAFPDVNLEWLVLGKGQMLRENISRTTLLDAEERIKELKDYNNLLREKISLLESELTLERKKLTSLLERINVESILQ